ncbi:NRDE family protein [Dongia rigui]|uniref:NRDE family protein n=1 Tax=Dongia rigui TaxID=940149 RepID=A0ABU5DSD3_9PROT|nr:NRDE family protein [Dongia rigui]MDY0870324.1 NRDE family protein [Dongia rigui]
MCSVIILSRPDHDWPILIASNRDEMHERPWAPPARHWSDRPEVVAGKDVLAGGSWLGINDFGVVAGILNRRDTLGPQAGKRSRGELVLDALDFADAEAAVAMLQELDAAAYRPFNMVVADNTHAYWLRNLGQEIEAIALLPGLSMITAMDLNDMSSARTRHFLPRWREAALPDPGSGDWDAWTKVLQSREYEPSGDVFDAMYVVSNTGFGTVSSSLIALPSVNHSDRAPVWRFLGGRPESQGWVDIDLR